MKTKFKVKYFLRQQPQPLQFTFTFISPVTYVLLQLLILLLRSLSIGPLSNNILVWLTD